MWAEDDSGDYETSDRSSEDDSDEDRTSWVSEADSDSVMGSDPEEGSVEEDVECNLLLRRDEDGCQSKGEQLSREDILEGFCQGQEGRVILEQVQSESEW